jgi:hypothetical protein
MAQTKIFSLGGIGAPCCCGGGASITCSPCAIPASNLTLSYTNVIYGNGSTALVYSSIGPAWTSACSNGLLYKLLCTSGSIELRVIYFTTGACPTGTQQYCSNKRATPFALTLASYTCSPFSLLFNSSSAGCPTITNAGYTQFQVT